MTIPCKAKDGFECPFFRFCLARLNDPSIIGCGYALYYYGIIDYKSVYVVHKVITSGGKEKPNRKKKTKKYKGRKNE